MGSIVGMSQKRLNLKSCLLQLLMKLQRFIENYRKDRSEKIHSPDRSSVFRTSQSIGTLNSRDESATDRSFAIKEIPLHTHLSAHKRESTQEVELLKDLCESERPTAKCKVEEKECLQPIQEFTYQPEPQRNHEVLTATFSKPKQNVLSKPNFSFRPEPVEELNDDLYEEAPSKCEEHTEDKLVFLLSREEQQFLLQYEALVERVQKLQQQNLTLEQQWLQEEKLSLRYDQGCGMLEQQVANLKERVTTIIQQNIEIENMIKQMLLKQEMQKYRYFTKEDSRRIVKKQQLPPKIKYGY